MANAVESTIIIEPKTRVFELDFSGLWHHRELLYFLVWRDLKVRYKQTIIGIGWALFQPLISMVIFTVIFGKLAKIPSDGLPYSIFVYSALLPWNYFATSLQRCVASVVGDAPLISKVYFPRLILPIAGTLSGLADFSVSFILLLILAFFHGISVSLNVLVLPLFLLLSLATALAVGLWLSALNVRYRDVGYTIPFLVQVWMYASPILYSVSIIPDKYRFIYGLNPMAGVIEGFRWALFAKDSPDRLLMSISVFVVVLLLTGGLLFFRGMEKTFADVV